MYKRTVHIITLSIIPELLKLTGRTKITDPIIALTSDTVIPKLDYCSKI